VADDLVFHFVEGMEEVLPAALGPAPAGAGAESGRAGAIVVPTGDPELEETGELPLVEQEAAPSDPRLS